MQGASKANIPMLMAALCAPIALAVMAAAVWFAGNFAVAGTLRLFSALAA